MHTKYSVAEVRAWSPRSVMVVNRVTPTLVARLMNFGAGFYWLGFRFFYLGLPFLMWLFSHWAMFGTGLLLIVGMWWFDDPGVRHLHAKRDEGVPGDGYVGQSSGLSVGGSGLSGGGSGLSVGGDDARRRISAGKVAT